MPLKTRDHIGIFQKYKVMGSLLCNAQGIYYWRWAWEAPAGNGQDHFVTKVGYQAQCTSDSIKTRPTLSAWIRPARDPRNVKCNSPVEWTHGRM